MKRKFTRVALLLIMTMITSITLVSCSPEEPGKIVKGELLSYSTQINYQLKISTDTLVFEDIISTTMATIDVQKDFIKLVAPSVDDENDVIVYYVRKGDTTLVHKYIDGVSDDQTDIEISFDLVRSSTLASRALIFEGYIDYLVQDVDNVNMYTVKDKNKDEYYKEVEDLILEIESINVLTSLFAVPNKGVVDSIYTAGVNNMVADAPFALITNLSCKTASNTDDIVLPNDIMTSL